MLLSFVAGIGIGILHLLGLRLSVAYLISQRFSVVLFVLSLFVRLAVVLTCIQLVAQGHVERYLAILVGFASSRVLAHLCPKQWGYK